MLSSFRTITLSRGRNLKTREFYVQLPIQRYEKSNCLAESNILDSTPGLDTESTITEVALRVPRCQPRCLGTRRLGLRFQERDKNLEHLCRPSGGRRDKREFPDREPANKSQTRARLRRRCCGSLRRWILLANLPQYSANLTTSQTAAHAQPTL
jgi:hypothetical protein